MYLLIIFVLGLSCLKYASSTTYLCQAGQMANCQTSTCITCQAGTFSSTGWLQGNGCTNGVAEAYCQSCFPGTYSAAGSGTCSYCPPGTYSLTGSSSCLPCRAGYYCPNTPPSGTALVIPPDYVNAVCGRAIGYTFECPYLICPSATPFSAPGSSKLADCTVAPSTTAVVATTTHAVTTASVTTQIAATAAASSSSSVSAALIGGLSAAGFVVVMVGVGIAVYWYKRNQGPNKETSPLIESDDV